MQAMRSGNGFKLKGAKALVVDGHTADLLIVAARTGGAAGEANGLTLFLVDPKAKGVATERTVMVDAHNAARIEFDNVEIDADHVLGEVDQGGALLEDVLNIGRGAVASEMVGLSEEVFGRTVTYLKERKQFGKLIGEFQALQHRAAAALYRYRNHPRRGAEGAAGAGCRFRQGGRGGGGGESPRRHHRDASGAGRRADAWRHGHDRPVRHRLLHEARAGLPGAVRRQPISTPTSWRGRRAIDRRLEERAARARTTQPAMWLHPSRRAIRARQDEGVGFSADAWPASRHHASDPKLDARHTAGHDDWFVAAACLTGSAARTGCRRRSRAGSARAGSAAWIRRRHCGRRSRRNCRHGG